jgi:thiamine-monophosphate kinase
VQANRIRPEGVPVISVSDAGEFGLIRRLAGRFPATPDVVLGPGDDAAVVAAPDARVVATTDLMVDGRHFRRDWSSAYDVGRKAAAANLADVVAMGARPTALLVGLAAPADLELAWADDLADGLRDECAVVGATVVGGDVVASDTLTIAVAALGDLEGRAPVTRAGARPGDVVLLAGEPGRAAAGLGLLRSGHRDHPLTAAHRRPEPPYSAALAAARAGAATAMIDVSDGLIADLEHVAVASGVRIDLDVALIPVASGLSEAADLLGADITEWLLGGGDDHCFALTAAASIDDLPVIGRVAPAEDPATASVHVTGASWHGARGHEHFR